MPAARWRGPGSDQSPPDESDHFHLRFQESCRVAEPPRFEDFFYCATGLPRDHRMWFRSKDWQLVPLRADSHSVHFELDSTTTTIAADQVGQAKGQVLELTACQPEEWPQLGDRFANLAQTWRETRSDQVIEFIGERLGK